ncbi:MAG TPA: glycosyltransferase family 2 protein [Candidatus Paceibacterota bacterium]|nr:glycosyltransferase family 2 protein [Candidatus Paceibacterota bacterium]
MKTLSIVIPCYNEESTIGELLDRVLAVALPGWNKEVIVVDDCSKDGTRAILKGYESRIKVIYQEKNGGKGTAVRRGLSEASGDHALIQDADLEYDPADIPRLLAKIDGGAADVVFGSRNLDPQGRRGGLIPYLGASLITLELNLLYGLALTDACTCYKLFPAATAPDFGTGGFESELVFTAELARRGYRFAEAPISYDPRDVAHGKKIRYRDGVQAIIAILADWLRHGRRVTEGDERN